MEIRIQKSGKRMIAGFFGELDHHNAAEVRRILDDELLDERITELVFDMRGTTFMDSSGLGVVLGRYRTIAGRGGAMFIGGAGKSTERILRMAGVYALAQRFNFEGETL